MVTMDYVTLSPSESERLLSAGNPEAALLYLYIRATGDAELKNAEQRLRIPAQNLSWAHTLLKRLGLLDELQTSARYDTARAPVYTGQMVADYAAGDASFKPLQSEIENRLGRSLSTEDMKILLSIRDYLRLPAEVVAMALTCCIQKQAYSNRTHGTDRTVTMRTLERECYDWANREINTLQKASEYISRSLELADPVAAVRRALGLDRQLISVEREYVESWLKFGFSVDAIRIAYEKTVLRTGKLTWPYMNRIMLNWHEKNLHSAEEITAGDRPKPEPEVPGVGTFTPGRQELAAVNNLRGFLDSMKEGTE